MDLSDIPTGDLNTVLTAVKAGNLKSVPTGLLQKVLGKFPGKSPETSLPADIYKGHLERFQSGFADPKHVPALLGDGYSKPQTSKNGVLTAQGPNGLYFHDESNFFPNTTQGGDLGEKIGNALESMHPLNWLEAHAGGSLPLAGMAAGGLLGKPGGRTSSTALAGVLGGVGSLAKDSLGHLMGVNDMSPEELANNAGDEAALGSLSEVGGDLIKGVPGVIRGVRGGNYLMNKAAEGAAQLAKIPAFATSVLTTGQVPMEASVRAIMRPSEVRAANAAKAAQAIQSENLATVDRAGVGVGRARSGITGFPEVPGSGNDKILNTLQGLREHQDLLREAEPNSVGTSKLDPNEVAHADELTMRNLTRNRWSQDPLPNAISSRPNLVEAPFTPVEHYVDEFDPSMRQVIQSGPVDPNKITQGYMNTVPEASASDLLKFTDHLDNEEIAGNAYTKNPNKIKSPAMDAYNQRIRKRVKGILHEAYPEYAEADRGYSTASGNQKILAPLGNESGMENFVAGLANKESKGTNQIVSDALRGNAPNALENELGDYQAQKAFDVSPFWHGAPKVLGQGIVGASTMGAATHSPWASLAGALGAMGLNNPATHYAAYTLGIPRLPALGLENYFQRSPWAQIDQPGGSR